MRLLVALLAALAAAGTTPEREVDQNLLIACGDGDIDEVRALLARGADARVASRDGETPLHLAGIRGDVALVRLLVLAGGDVNARCADVGDASLHGISGKAKAPMEPPDEYLCPITQELMLDPVIASDGHTYERDAIERWFSKKMISPKTGSDLETSTLFPNHVMRRQIIEWKEVHQEE